MTELKEILNLIKEDEMTDSVSEEEKPKELQEHDAEIFREAYKAMAEVQESGQFIAIICRPGTKPNGKLGKEVGLDFEELLYACPATTAEATATNNMLVRSNVVQVFNV